MNEQQNAELQEQDVDVQELSDEELIEVSGGRSNGKVLCPGGTRRVCGTINGVYKCRCEPYAPVENPQES